MKASAGYVIRRTSAYKSTNPDLNPQPDVKILGREFQILGLISEIQRFIYLFYLSIYLLIYLCILCFKVDLHLAYEKPISINKNSAYISVNRLPSNDDNNKTKYLLVRQNQHVAIRIFAWEIRLSYFDFLIFRLKHFRLLQFLITLGTSVHIFGAM